LDGIIITEVNTAIEIDNEVRQKEQNQYQRCFFLYYSVKHFHSERMCLCLKNTLETC
jgi:hypothetical protein